MLAMLALLDPTWEVVISTLVVILLIVLIVRR
jgi:hypothetical protein